MVGGYGPRRLRRSLEIAVAAAVVTVAGCSGSDAAVVDSATVSVPGTASSSDVDETPDVGSTATSPPVVADGPLADGPLAEVCPSTIAIQTASLPSPALGPLYALLGPDAVVDVAAQRVSSSLVRVDGTVEDVVLEIRAGGPAVDFRSPLALLTEDPGLLLAQASTAVAIRDAAVAPSVGVVTLTDRSHDALIVDPATHPGVDTVEAVRDAGIEVRHVTDEPFIAYLAASGLLAPGQLVPGFDGEPAAFVQSGGAISQQGDLLVEPVLLPSLSQWAQPVTAIDAASAGWAVHDDELAARPADIEEHRACLGRLVPVIQQAIAAYVADPGPTNEAMSDFRSRFAPLARLTPDLMDAGVAVGRDAGVFGDGTNATVGDFDIERLEPFLPELAAVLGVDAVAVDELLTKEFVDPTITSGE